MRTSASSGLDPNGLTWYPGTAVTGSPGPRAGRAFGGRAGQALAAAANNMYGAFREDASRTVIRQSIELLQ